MGWWTDHVVPHIVETALRSKPVGEFRQRALAGIEGEVVEIGFGSGLTLRHYPSTVSKIYAVEPSELARRMAAPRIAESAIPVELIGLDGQSIPLPDASVDAAVSTFTLCTIPAADVALGEIARVLRPGGRLHLLEHGLSDDPRIAAWQHRLNGMEQRVAGGCNLDRPVDELVTDAGFQLERLEHPEMPGPGFMKPWGYLYLGVARAGQDGGNGPGERGGI